MKEHRQKDKKEVLVYEIFSKIFLVLGFISIFLAIMLDDQRPDENWMTYGIIVFLLLNVVSLYLKSIIKADKDVNKLEKKKELYNNLELSEVDFTSYEEIEAGLVENKYELLSNGYYHKRIKSTGICLYAKFLKVVNLEDSVARECVKFKKFYENNCQAINGILFVTLKEIKDSDKEFVRILSRDYLLLEEAALNKEKLSVITVIVDEVNKKAYYLDAQDSYTTRIYSHGSIILRKIFKK